jgi:hypothetical protein
MRSNVFSVLGNISANHLLEGAEVLSALSYNSSRLHFKENFLKSG